jgi:hypothetical protein
VYICIAALVLCLSSRAAPPDLLASYTQLHSIETDCARCETVLQMRFVCAAASAITQLSPTLPCGCFLQALLAAGLV